MPITVAGNIAQAKWYEETAKKVIKFKEANDAAAQSVSYSSDQLQKGKITLENFGDSMSRAVGKVLLWQVAILGVYGTWRKVTETLTIWKDLELTLTRISITTGAVSGALEDYFSRVADVAIKFGMPIDKTLVGMDLALRATGNLEDQTKRTATATKLLSDASVLANISGMQYSQAMDILVGALRQTGKGMDEGLTLLDKWQAVAKIASTNVNDLSQAFAILGDVALSSGLSIDQVNGMVAALAASTTLSATEVGNAVRAIMGTMFTPSSLSTIQKMGIAVVDVNGNLLNAWDIMSQISEKRLAGAFSPDEWNRLTYVMAGGVRRQSQASTLISHMADAQKAATASAKANGDALQANAKIVNTLVNAWDAYNAAQGKAIFNFGEQSGMIKDITNLLQNLTKTFSGLSDASDTMYKLGKAIIYAAGALATLRLAGAALGWMGLKGATRAGVIGDIKGLGVSALGMIPGALPFMGYQMGQRYYRGGAWRQNLPGMGGGRFAPVPMGKGMTAEVPYFPLSATLGGYAAKAGSWLTRGGAGMAMYGGMGAGALVAATGANWQSSVGAGIGGAIGGALLGPIGIAVGGGIGTIIGQVAADAFTSKEERIRGMFSDAAEQMGVDLSDVITKLNVAAIQARPAPYPQIRKGLLESLGGLPPMEGGGIPTTNEVFQQIQWEKGLGALDNLRQALDAGLISQEEYNEALGTTSLKWEEIDNVVKYYMFAQKAIASGDVEMIKQGKEVLKILNDQLEARKADIKLQEDKKYGRFVPRGQVRVVAPEEYAAYQKALTGLPGIEEYVKGITGLEAKDRETATYSLIDSESKLIQTYEISNLGQELLNISVRELTKAVDRSIDATYNIPTGYKMPGRFWYQQMLGGRQGGGPINETGPYYMHKGEQVVTPQFSSGVASILNNSYRSMMVSQQYLSSINLGIMGIRQELSNIKEVLSMPNRVSNGTFSKISGSGFVGVPTFGSRGLL